MTIQFYPKGIGFMDSETIPLMEQSNEVEIITQFA